jgi:hypothetical protein
MFEGGGPTQLTRRGFTKDFTKWGSGVDVIAEGYLHRGLPLRASGLVLTYPDGRTLFVGSPGIGAPPGRAGTAR